MSWLTAITDLREHVSDSPKDKLSYRKRVIGQINSINLRFKTFEYRRVTDLTTAVAPEGVYVNGSPVSVSTDNLEIGEFVLSVAPVDGDIVEATYYSQWFFDAELETFLRQASNFVSIGDDYTLVPGGLQQAVLDYCANLCYRELAVYFARNISETYMLQEAPQKDRFAIVDSYQKMAKDFESRAKTLRDDYYSRQGQANAPLFGISAGRVRDVPPKA